LNDNFQLWNLSDESCPIGTIPIRRTTKEDILRAKSVNMFGRKSNRFRRDAAEIGHVVCNHRMFILFLRIQLPKLRFLFFF